MSLVSTGAVLPGGRQQHLRRRQAADDAQQRAVGGPGHVRGAGADQQASLPSGGVPGW